jgi:hypothetical protein
VANAITRAQGGKREPEHLLLAAILLPLLSGIVGCFLFGAATANNHSWVIGLVGAGLVLFGFLGVNTAVNVYVVESYPVFAGSALANVASMRFAIGLILDISSPFPSWVAQRGLFTSFAIIAAVMMVVSLGVALLWFFGRILRRWTAGSVHGVRIEKKIVDVKSVRIGPSLTYST